jgi:DNA-binding response OmpR family regulator
MKKILIVEDDPKIAMALAIRFKASGYEAFMAHDAVMGTNAAVEHQPDLVLLDISMPAGDGFGVAERIQTLLPKLTPIIFLTASRQPGFREKATAMGAAGYFEKPYDAVKLLAAVERALAEESPIPPDHPFPLVVVPFEQPPIPA